MRHVYGLSDDTGSIRYIGQTSGTPEARLIGLRRSAKGAFAEWLSGAVVPVILWSGTDEDADAAERWFIGQHRSTLFNVRAGGRRSSPARYQRLLRPVVLTPDGDTLLITCPTLPEVTTFAENAALIVKRANDAIEEALWARPR